ncbi:hypothetical protein EYW49_03510 [Siculibacillus lacustris]|uniref:PEP-CTERM sorting domain-containing protein n=1 Tax=Siculibacillus lacustris TaxID=1549641 RepID=A0A4Q9VZH8_9HYPH|nr:hypothetical protein [Siculibacillus lacustris]TBW40806.1 hypothetical protein EYW49_03510 [Siculibacillus lacustris]
MRISHAIKAICLSYILILSATPASHATDVTVGTHEFDWGILNDVAEFQQVYSSSLFNGTTTINSLSLYNASTSTNFSDPTLLTVSFYQTTKNIGALSTDLSSNKGNLISNFGSFNISASLTGGIYQYGSFIGGLLTFAGNAFTYDPSKGNLLVDFVASDSPYRDQPTLQAFGANPLVSIAYNGSLGQSDAGAYAGNYGYVTTFGTVAAVPGPQAGVGLPAILGLMGFWLYRRRSIHARAA